MSTKISIISLDLIDDPKLAMRSETDDHDLEELMRDMDAVGLIEPIVVRPVGERYEVIAGHRRLRAAQLLGWPEIECKIVDVDDHEALRMRLIENISRKDVDPVDEACFIAEVMRVYGWDITEVAERLKRSKEWVQKRLTILTMPDYIQEHLHFKKYSLEAALWINRIEDEKTKRYYANWGAQNGVTAIQAKRWYFNLKEAKNADMIKNVEVMSQGDDIPQVKKLVQCFGCLEDIELEKAISVWVCPECKENRKKINI